MYIPIYTELQFNEIPYHHPILNSVETLSFKDV